MKSNHLYISKFNFTDEKIGIYYDKDDYAGFGRRVVAGAIDILVIMVFSTLFILFLKFLNNRIDIDLAIIFLINLAFIYLTFIKRSDFRTIGYRITGIKVINIDGSKPSLYNMFQRVIFFIVGTYDYSKSIELIKKDSAKQTIRDKYLGNYVIKVNAVPKGSGPIITAMNSYGKRRIFRYKKVKKDGLIGHFLKGLQKKIDIS